PDKIKALVEGFDDDALLTITADGGAAKISGGDGAFRLPSVVTPMVPAIAIAGEAPAPIKINAKDLLLLFGPIQAPEDQTSSRPYLCGLHIDSARPGRLASVATNGALLLSATIETTGMFPATTVPTTAIGIATRTVKAAKPDIVRLRRSDRLLEIAGPDF